MFNKLLLSVLFFSTFTFAQTNTVDSNEVENFDYGNIGSISKEMLKILKINKDKDSVENQLQAILNLEESLHEYYNSIEADRNAESMFKIELSYCSEFRLQPSKVSKLRLLLFNDLKPKHKISTTYDCYVNSLNQFAQIN